jgi:hypothetical protein
LPFMAVTVTVFFDLLVVFTPYDNRRPRDGRGVSKGALHGRVHFPTGG